MEKSEHFLARLLELPRVQEVDVRRGIVRQAITALGQDEQSGGPLALAGVDPRALGRSVQMALADGFLDDLDFIAPSVAAVALYQMAGALPLGQERRAIGRKLLTHLYQGDAETFASLASRMAMASTRPLRGAGIRARVALATCLRSDGEAAVDRLALAIVMRRELAREWVNSSATGSLPDRRLAGRLIERAAREAARRAEAGDVYPLRIFRAVVNPKYQTPPRPDGANSVSAAWRSLLADRETLVWRHVAIARGTLGHVVPEFVDEIRSMLEPHLSPTEWRRGAASLVARIATDRERGMRDARELLDGPLLKRDPGISMAMIWGLLPVAEVEPEAAEELAEAIARISPISIADSMVELRHQVADFGDAAASLCAQALRTSLAQHEVDDGLSALARSILGDLEGAKAEESELRDAVTRALLAFGSEGSMAAHGLARDALHIASERVGELEGLDIVYGPGSGAGEQRRRAMTLLRDIDATLLETRLLDNLLLLDRPPGSDATGVSSVDDLDARLARWLLDGRRRQASSDEIRQQATLHQRQLRTLLHLIDGGSTEFDDDHERRVRVRARWTTAVRTFVDYLAEKPSTRLTRAIIATIARTFDALVRDGAAEPVDVFLYAALYLGEPSHLAVVAEASMQPDVVQLLSHYLGFAQPEYEGKDQITDRLNGFKRFLHAFPTQSTLRGEALRVTAWRLVHALEQVDQADSLQALVPSPDAANVDPLATIDDAIGQLQQLVIGAERRCSDRVKRLQAVIPQRHALALAVENAVRTGQHGGLADALASTALAAEANLPPHLAQLISKTLPQIESLPVEQGAIQPIPLVNAKLNLPDWIPPRRIVGGFYVLKQLGGGNVGTVFVVKRAEERHESDAERFALKVPEYNVTAARTMSEKEFLKLFREEAGALLSIPEHDNLARFVTFDAGAKPKPILVMELIEGLNVERAVGSAALSMQSALTILEGVVDGLAAMHESGIAHLDVKPSNIILRDADGVPVLVDFGLAGRRVRPGCATLCYGAPEVWETAPGGRAPGPATAADVYAFGCFAFEVLTSHTLFDGTSDVGIISAHITHDGLPPAVERMAATALQPLAMFLHQCLRYDPAQRSTMAQLRDELVTLRPLLEGRSWPLHDAK